MRHEETAVAMASGYSKATGKLPAVMLHTTVGTLHATMALRIAKHERVPMVVMAGESVGFASLPRRKVGRQWLRLLTDVGGPARLAEPSVKWSFGLNTELLLAQTVQRACQLAMAAPRGPVFLSVPIEHLMQDAVKRLRRRAPCRPRPRRTPQRWTSLQGGYPNQGGRSSSPRKPVAIRPQCARSSSSPRSSARRSPRPGSRTTSIFRAITLSTRALRSKT